MSFAGLKTFDGNLKRLMASDAFKQANEAQKLDLGYKLFFSKYGIGSFFGFGKVHQLPEKDNSSNATTSGS